MFQMVKIGISILLMHPLHLGVVHMNIDNQYKANIEIRLFTDDLENAIFYALNEKHVINHSDENSLELVSSYLNDKIKISDGNSIKLLKIQSLEKDKDVSVIKYQTTLGEWNSLSFCCEFFFELFNDQTNLLIVKTPSIEEGFRMDKSKSCVIVEE